jgi:hypothetical protein
VLARASVLLAAVVLGSAVPAAGASAARAPRKPSAPPPPAAPVVLPPDLVALAQKMQALHLSSERFKLRLALSASGPHAKEMEVFLRLFDIELSGEVCNSPPAAALKLTILGHTLSVRVVGERSYVYEPAIARHDHGRPWIDAGRRGPAGSGAGPGGADFSSGVGVTSFKRLVTALAGARSITELGGGTVDGQAITGFRATVAASALEEPAPLVNAKPKGLFSPIGVGSAAKEVPGTALLELFIAPNGVPVQTRIRAHEEGATATILYDIYAVNFPLNVQPPPKSQTISAAALRALERKRSSRRAHHGEGEQR